MIDDSTVAGFRTVCVTCGHLWRRGPRRVVDGAAHGQAMVFVDPQGEPYRADSADELAALIEGAPGSWVPLRNTFMTDL